MAEYVATDAARDLYELLPEVYRLADEEQVPALPLLKYLEGPGGLMQAVRDVLTDAIDGTLFDPERVEDDDVILWLAQMMGVDTRNVPPDVALDDLRSRADDGVPAVGTYSHIAARARLFLQRSVGAANPQIEAMPGPEDWEIALVVREDSVPDADLDAFVAQVQASAAVPAGFFIRAYVAEATWDQFDAAKGQDWASFTAQVRTWSQHDSVGTVLDDVG